MTYDDLLIEADSNSLITKEKPLLAHNGRIKGDRIAIRQDLTETEKKCTLAEELAHYYVNSGDLSNMDKTENRKQEYKARIAAFDRLIGLQRLIDCYKRGGCHNLYNMADYLEVTEEFLLEALKYYKNKYGVCVRSQDYLIYFHPALAIIEFK